MKYFTIEWTIVESDNDGNLLNEWHREYDLSTQDHTWDPDHYINVMIDEIENPEDFTDEHP